MKCPKCDQPVEPSAVFCGNCGQQLQQDGAAQPAPVVPVSPVSPVPLVNPGAPASVVPGQTASPFVPGLVPGAQPMPGQHVPAYAMGQAKAAEGSAYLTWAVVLAVLSIPGAIIPLVGLALSITAIVFAAKHHHAGTGRMVTAIVIGSIGALLSLAAWGYNVNQHYKHTAFLEPSSSVTSISIVQRSPALYQTLLTTNY